MRPNYLLALLPNLPAVLATALPAGVHEFTPQWELEPSPGEKVVLNGTVEQVVAELAQINPDYSPFAPAASGDRGPSLERRQKAELFPRDKVVCKKPGWRNVHTSEAGVGIRYLRTVKGQVRGDPGPANCGRVSCGYGAAVWFCNDNTHGITVESFTQIADLVEAIQYHCTTCWDGWYHGQAFHPTDNWDIFIHHEKC